MRWKEYSALLSTPAFIAELQAAADAGQEIPESWFDPTALLAMSRTLAHPNSDLVYVEIYKNLDAPTGWQLVSTTTAEGMRQAWLDAQKQTSARAKLAAAQKDIEAAIYEVLCRHGIEYGRVSVENLLGGEYHFHVIVHDLEQLEPRYVESARIPKKE